MFIGKKIKVPGQHDLSYAALIVLKAISDFPEGSYGYSLMQELTEKYSWHVKSGTVYPILKRLVEKKFIQKKEGESRQKLYQITPLGHELLKSLETELELIENRSTLDAGDAGILLAKIHDYCAGLSIQGSDPDRINVIRQDLESLKASLGQILDLIEQKLQDAQKMP